MQGCINALNYFMYIIGGDCDRGGAGLRVIAPPVQTFFSSQKMPF